MRSFGYSEDDGPEVERATVTAANRTQNQFRTHLVQKFSKFAKVAHELWKMLKNGAGVELAQLAENHAELADWLNKKPLDAETRPCVPEKPALGGRDWEDLKKWWNPDLGEVI